jgi:HEAT repeat protein
MRSSIITTAAVSALGLAVALAFFMAERTHPRAAMKAETTSKPAEAAASPPTGGSQALLELGAVKDAYERTGDVRERTELLRRAPELGDPGVVRWLAGIAQSDPVLASQASAALGAVSNPAAGDDLVEIFSGSAPTLVRANAARALSRCGGARQASVLAAAIPDRGQPLRVRQEAALAIGKIGEPSLAPVLIAAVEQTAHDATVDGEQLRISLLRALGDLHSGEAHAFLERYSREKLSQTERAFVSRALQTRS